jgi:hypothetical protein
MITGPSDPFNEKSWWDWIGLWTAIYMVAIGVSFLILAPMFIPVAVAMFVMLFIV